MDWPFAVRAGVESVLAAWLLVVIPTLAVFLATSSFDAAAALSLGSALRTGTALWGLGLGGSVGSASEADGALALPLLGVTLAQAWLTAGAVRRARLTGPLAGIWTVGAATLTSLLLVLLLGPSGTGSLPAVLGSAVLALLVTACSLQRQGRGSERLARAWARRPRWVDPALALGRLTARGVAVLVAVVAVLAVIGGLHRFTRLTAAVGTGGVLPWIGLLLLQIGWVPTTLLWALAWLAGPGFVVGTGTVFAPGRVVAGSVPSLPLLGFLPTDAMAHVGSYVPLALCLVALGAVWWRRRELAALALPEALIAAAAAAVGLSLLVLIGCLLASGSIGPGRMSDVGPRSALVAGLVLLEVGAAMLAGTALVHPWTRRATEQGVEHTRAPPTTPPTPHAPGIDAARERRAESRRERERVRAEAPMASEDDVRDDPRDEEPANENAEPARGPATAPLEVVPAPESEPEPETVPIEVVPEAPRFTGWRARLADRLDRDEAETRAPTDSDATEHRIDDPHRRAEDE